jgi:pyruvate/2-oxoglutarate dehydrogenase complex dihydrolipoamide acyltransferase (E2) component
MRENHTGYTVVPFARVRRLSIDVMELVYRQRTGHILFEVDVTDARKAIRESRATTRALSFTAFIVASFAHTVSKDRRMHAYRKGRGQMILFDDVDAAVAVEREVEGEKVVVACVVRAADKKAVADIHREIRSAQVGPVPLARAVWWLPLWLLIPAPIRRFLYAAFLRDPGRRKRRSGTVGVTSIGMFGGGVDWGIAQTDYTLCLTVGGIARRPMMVRDRGGNERIEPREILSLTISLDRGLIGGAPAARFGARLKKVIESGAILREPRGDAQERALAR